MIVSCLSIKISNFEGRSPVAGFGLNDNQLYLHWIMNSVYKLYEHREIKWSSSFFEADKSLHVVGVNCQIFMTWNINPKSYSDSERTQCYCVFLTGSRIKYFFACCL